MAKRYNKNGGKVKELHSRDEEEALCGAVLIAPDEAMKHGVAPGDFYLEHLGLIWKAASDLVQDGITPDNVTVADALRRAGKLDQVGGKAYLAELITRCPNAYNVEGYAQSVKDYAVRRVAGRALRDAYAEVHNLDASPYDPQHAIDALIGSVKTGKTGKTGKTPWQETVDLARIEGGGVNWITPQFLHGRGITIVAGVPGIGKTTFAVELSHALATGGLFLGERVEPTRVLWLSFEHSARSIRDKHDRIGDIPEGWVMCPREPEPLTKRSLDSYVHSFESLGVRVVIVDTLADWLALEDLDRTAVVRSGVALIREVCDRTGVAVLAIGHPGKGRNLDNVYSLANSYIFSAKSDVVALMVETPASDIPGAQSNLEYAELRVRKNRHGEGVWSMSLLKQNYRFKPLQSDVRPLTEYDHIVACVRENGGLMFAQDLYEKLAHLGSHKRLRRMTRDLEGAGKLVAGHDRGNKNRLFFCLPDADLSQHFDDEAQVSFPSLDSFPSFPSFSEGGEKPNGAIQDLEQRLTEVYEQWQATGAEDLEGEYNALNERYKALCESETQQA